MNTVRPLHVTRLAILVIIALIYNSCSDSSEETQASTDDQPFQEAVSTEGMVSAAHPLATAAGVKMLEHGGNAIDAAIAAAFTLSVVEPSMSGIGGRLQAIVRTPDGLIHGIDATTTAPEGYDRETAAQASYGYQVIGVPGVVAGLATLLADFGTLKLEEVMAPAIEYAEEGYRLLPLEAARHASMKDRLMEFEGSRKYFINPEDTLTYREGEIFRQPDLASTLKLIAANGPDVFYKGKIAELIVADVQANGGVLTMEALANYSVERPEVLTSGYRGIDTNGLWLPSYGAITLEILNILENLPMSDLADSEYASVVNQAIELAYKDRYGQRSLEDGKRLITKEYAAKLAGEIRVGKVTLGEKVKPMGSEALADAFSDGLDGHTTSLAAADSEGMMIALTQSLGPNMGSKVATPGLGFLYASTLGGYLSHFKGSRASSHISPMILTMNGQPYMAIGAAGGSRIPSAIVQVISRVIDQRMGLYDALGAARVHPFGADSLYVENHEGLFWAMEDFKFLSENGFFVEQLSQKGRFGRVHAVMFLQDSGEWLGAADPDWEGSAKGPEINRGEQ